MRRERRGSQQLFIGAVCFAMLVLAYDRDREVTTGPASPGKGAHALARVHGSKYRRPDEDLFVALAQEEPTIAGVFIDADGSLASFVADSTRLVTARGVK